MSNPVVPHPTNVQPPGALAGRLTVATYDTYPEAQSAVEHLTKNDFPVHRVAIVGHDLKVVEQVLGKTNFAWAALRGAGSGALTGVLIGWIFGIFNWIRPLETGLLLAFYGLIFGAIVGALFGLIAHALQRGQRDFTAVSVVAPSRYDVVADPEVAEAAARLLEQRGR
jgi:hypothetical protein